MRKGETGVSVCSFVLFLQGVVCDAPRRMSEKGAAVCFFVSFTRAWLVMPPGDLVRMGMLGVAVCSTVSSWRTL